MAFSDLPLLNALLNGSATVFLLLGYRFIRRKKQRAHHTCMILAVVASCLFLVCYLVYHFQVGSVPFNGEGWVRSVYFTILISHTLLAMTLPVLVPLTLSRAMKKRYDLHKRIARLTLPTWIYVSITGVTIYILLYRLFPY
jgi:uncharacterized membrane protein YozB (DUF420 family)